MDVITYLDQNIITFIELIGSITVGLLIRDFASNMIAGWMFYINKDFREGDHIVIDGEPGIVVKVGIRQTIFGVMSCHGYVWRYVDNTRVKYVKIEKVIKAADNEQRKEE